MIRQAGYAPGRDIRIEFTGIRPGEKLFEELDVTGKAYRRTGHAKIYVAMCGDTSAAEVSADVERVLADASDDISAAVKSLARWC